MLHYTLQWIGQTIDESEAFEFIEKITTENWLRW